MKRLSSSSSRPKSTGGITGIVPCGTTGESPTLDHAEHTRVIELAREVRARDAARSSAARARTPPPRPSRLTEEAEKLGADAALLVAPYYNKPSQEGLFRHFKAIAEATKLPLILYSIPGRCGIEIGVETVVRLAKACPNIVAIKEAGGSVDRVSQLRHGTAAGVRRFCPATTRSPCRSWRRARSAWSASRRISSRSEIRHLVNACAAGKIDDAPAPCTSVSTRCSRTSSSSRIPCRSRQRSPAPGA